MAINICYSLSCVIQWHDLPCHPLPVAMTQVPRCEVPLTATAPKNSLSSLVSTRGQAGGCVRWGISHRVCRAGTTGVLQTKMKRGDVIRSSHKLDLVNLKRNFSVRKTRKEDISKESHLLWQYFGDGGCEIHSVETLNLSKDWEDALAKKPQQISVGNRLLVRSDRS